MTVKEEVTRSDDGELGEDERTEDNIDMDCTAKIFLRTNGACA